MAKFQIKGSVLANALDRIYYAVDEKAATPAFSGVKFEVAGKEVRLSTRGSAIDTESMLPLNRSDTNCVFGLGLKLFADIIGTLPRTIDFDFELGDRFVRIFAGGSRFDLNLLSEATVFPQQNLNERMYTDLDMEKLLTGMGKVVYCHDDRSPEMYKRSICINAKHIVSTDGFRLSFVPNEAFKVPDERQIMLLIPTKSAERLAKIYAGMTGPAGIGADRSGAYIRCGGIYTATRVPEAKYPNYFSILPKSEPTLCVLPRVGLTESLKRVLVMIGEKGIKAVDLIFDEDRLRLIASGSGGEVMDSIATASPARGRVRVNGEFVVKALTKMTKDEVALEYRPGHAPVILTDGEHVNVFQQIPIGPDSLGPSQGG